MSVTVSLTYHSHTFSPWQVRTPSTCTIPGEEYRTCTDCQEEETRALPLAAHAYGDWIVEKPASMTEDGLEVRICSVCRARDEKKLPAGDYLPGDLNGDGTVDDKDAEYLLYHIFYPNQYPVRQDCDFNGDGAVDDKDAEYLLYHIFFPSDYPLTHGYPNITENRNEGQA